MTVIAWDGKTLAADRLMCNGYSKQETTKISRYGRELLGVCGNLSAGRETLDWYQAGALPDKYPTSNRGENSGASLVVVKPDGRVLKYESSPSAFEVEGKFAAFGCGDEAALVALSLGCSAKEAVEITCRFNSSCGGGVDVLTLEAK
jgi:hypothetical protein